MTLSSGSEARAVHDGQAVYGALLLHGYNAVVFGINYRAFWRCSPQQVVDLYERNITDEHLDIGVGTGYLLTRCSPSARRRIALADLNPHSLRHTAAQLAGYQVTCHRADALKPLPLPRASFGSVGLNFLLHCLPGPLSAKAAALDHATACLYPGGRLFGSTVLAHGVPVTPAGRRLMAHFNRRGIFHNAADSLDDLRDQLAARYPAFHLTTHGSVALFEAVVE